MEAVLPAPSVARYVPRRKRPSIWVVLPVLFLVAMSLLPLLYVAMKAWEAGWQEALCLICPFPLESRGCVPIIAPTQGPLTRVAYLNVSNPS